MRILQQAIELSICAIGIAAVLFLGGCSTVPVTPESLDQYINSHSELLTKAAATASAFALSKAEKDAEKRAELKQDINQVVEKVSRGLDAANAAAGGTLTPDDLAEDLKVRDETVQAAFDAAIVIYRDGYEHLQASQCAQKSLPWVKLILNATLIASKGLERATK